MATIHIDNRSYPANEQENLLQQCLSLGFNLPYFCWHPAMGSVGACRQCAVKQFKNEEDKHGKLVNGALREVPPLEELEEFSLDGVTYEAFNTSGGLGTLCETYAGKVRTLNYRTIRYPGHAAIMKALLNDLGLRDRRELALWVALFAIALVLTRGLPGLGRRDLARLALAGMLVVAIYHLSLNAGERLTTAATASVVVAAAPGIALAMAVAIGQERFSRRRAAGLAISLAGVVVVVLLGSGQRVSFANAHGPLLVVAAPVAFAAYNVLVKPLLPRYGVLPVTAAASLIGTAALLPFASGATIRRVSHLHAGGVALLLYLGLAATLAGYIGRSRGLRQLEASRTVAYLYVVPVVAIAIGLAPTRIGLPAFPVRSDTGLTVPEA